MLFRLLLPLLSLTLLLNTTYAQKEEVQQPDLAKELRKMRDEDQKLRIKWAKMYRKGLTESDKFKELTKKSIAADRANTARLREIINEFGWPTYDLVGRGPSNNAWLIAQHADRNPLFQAKYLPLLKEAVDNKQADASNYAYLYDRVKVSRGEKQKYATQSWTNNGLKNGTFYPLEDEENVQKNREAMGVERSVTDYASSMGFKYEILTHEAAAQKADALLKSYNKNVQKAKEAMQNKSYKEAADYYLEATAAYGHVTTEDFLEAARALSLAEHEEIGLATVFLTRALARGWQDFESVKTNSDFDYLRAERVGSWEDFLITMEQSHLDR